MTTPIQIITLSPNGEHVLNLQAQLAEQGFSSNCFAAVDGRLGMPALQPPEALDNARALRYRQTQVTATELGCYLSHYRAVQEAFLAGAEQLCLLEDDVVLEPAFGSVFRSLTQTVLQDLEFIRLMGLKYHRRKRVKALPAGHWLTRPIKGLCGTQGYLISRQGMEKVLHCGARIWRPIDKFYDHFWDSDLACFAIEPHVIYERPSTSSIQHAGTGKGGSRWQRRLTKQLYKVTRGTQRRLYQWQRRRAFRPTEPAGAHYGRTERIH